MPELDEFDEKLCHSFINQFSGDFQIIRIDDLERHFSYDASKLQTSFIPKKFRDRLRELDCYLRKKRGRELVEVHLSEV